MPIKQIEDLLIQQNILHQEGKIIFDLAGISFPVTSKDIIGSILQEWFENWLILNKINFKKPLNSQDWPDFILDNKYHLEIKAFNHEANPAFDLANFDAYTRSLLEHPNRLDSDYLIFAYTSKNNTIKIENFWIKKIWEITGKSDKNFLNLQVKQNIPINIRPKDWRGKSSFFISRQEFVYSLYQALIHFYPNRYQNWLDEITKAYFKKTNQNL